MREDDKMTKEQAEVEVQNFQKIFDVVRLLKVSEMACAEGSWEWSEKKEEERESEKSYCYDYWKKEQRCENCVSLRAILTKETKGKLEVMEGRIYQVIARYVEVDEEPYIMELIRCLDNDWSIGEANHEKLVDLFVHYNDKLYRDAVTDAYNRRYYEDELRRKKESAGVALIDLDDFKLYNDTYGHQTGDLALYTVIDVIRNNIRKSDKLIRFGGDEFLLVMPDIEGGVFAEKLKKIQEEIHNSSVMGYQNLKMSISAGGVICAGETIEQAVQRADKLMYQAKRNKNMVLTERDAIEEEQEKGGPKQKILVVDDSEMNREILKEMLKKDFDLMEAANGEEGIEMLKKYGRDVSLVLLDIIMPVMDGFEVLMEMNRRHWLEDIPVIMISGEEGQSYIRKAFKFGVSDYIRRPFDGQVVYQRVFNTIKLYAKQRRLMMLLTDQVQEKEKNNQMMVEVLSQIVEFRNGESGLHVMHINLLTRLLLEHLVEKTNHYNLSPDDCYMISMASAFHDIGKIGIDEKILNKPGKLTKEEFEQMKQHTVIGASMLDHMERYKDEPMIKLSRQICRWHHERYDGKGYPDGLKGEEIPIAAQVVSLADVYDALISKRAYKEAFSHEKAMQMILNGECGTFNPILLEAFVEIQDKLQRVMLQE